MIGPAQTRKALALGRAIAATTALLTSPVASVRHETPIRLGPLLVPSQLVQPACETLLPKTPAGVPMPARSPITPSQRVDGPRLTKVTGAPLEVHGNGRVIPKT